AGTIAADYAHHLARHDLESDILQCPESFTLLGRNRPESLPGKSRQLHQFFAQRQVAELTAVSGAGHAVGLAEMLHPQSRRHQPPDPQMTSAKWSSTLRKLSTPIR